MAYKNYIIYNTDSTASRIFELRTSDEDQIESIYSDQTSVGYIDTTAEITSIITNDSYILNDVLTDRIAIPTIAIDSSSVLSYNRETVTVSNIPVGSTVRTYYGYLEDGNIDSFLSADAITFYENVNDGEFITSFDAANSFYTIVVEAVDDPQYKKSYFYVEVT